MYNDDWTEYYPYDGDPNSGVCATDNKDAWFNVLPPYVGQKPLCQLYTNLTPPTPRNGGLFVCPSAVNKAPNPTTASPVFYYSISSCIHRDQQTKIGLRRDRMVSPGNTIIFCEEVEDNFPETNGKYDMVIRHSGGSNFVLGDGHVEWIPVSKFCRSGNTLCAPPLSNMAWDLSGPSGDWANVVPYHWWFYVYASTQ